MSIIPDKQIAAAAAKAGFQGEDLTIAVAVALAESGGNSEASNNVGAGHRGLWQISRLHQILANGDWKDPNWNAYVAYQVWKGQGWKAWQAYTNGSYTKFMSRARVATNDGKGVVTPGDITFLPNPIGGVIPVVPEALVPEPLRGLYSFFTVLTEPATWIRIAMFLAGAFLIVFGIMKITTLDNKVGAVAKKIGGAIL